MEIVKYLMDYPVFTAAAASAASLIAAASHADASAATISPFSRSQTPRSPSSIRSPTAQHMAAAEESRDAVSSAEFECGPQLEAQSSQLASESAAAAVVPVRALQPKHAAVARRQQLLSRVRMRVAVANSPLL
jgi:hypothetical protein